MQYESDVTYGIIWLWYGCDVHGVGAIRDDANVTQYQSDYFIWVWLYAMFVWYACDVRDM